MYAETVTLSHSNAKVTLNKKTGRELHVEATTWMESGAHLYDVHNSDECFDLASNSSLLETNAYAQELLSGNPMAGIVDAMAESVAPMVSGSLGAALAGAVQDKVAQVSIFLYRSG